MPVQGMHLITPSAAVATGAGSSATISANGSVSFSAITALELRGVFSSAYDNYKIVCRATQSTNNCEFLINMMSGTSVDTTTNYIYEVLIVSGTTVTGQRPTAQFAAVMNSLGTTSPNGCVIDVFGPFIAQPTVGRSIGMYGTTSVQIYESAFSHNVSSSFDGIKLTPNNGTTAGRVAVYGMRK